VVVTWTVLQAVAVAAATAGDHLTQIRHGFDRFRGPVALQSTDVPLQSKRENHVPLSIYFDFIFYANWILSVGNQVEWNRRIVFIHSRRFPTAAFCILRPTLSSNPKSGKCVTAAAQSFTRE
jgi:hypothetical protein